MKQWCHIYGFIYLFISIFLDSYCSLNSLGSKSSFQFLKWLDSTYETWQYPMSKVALRVCLLPWEAEISIYLSIKVSLVSNPNLNPTHHTSSKFDQILLSKFSHYILGESNDVFYWQEYNTPHKSQPQESNLENFHNYNFTCLCYAISSVTLACSGSVFWE